MPLSVHHPSWKKLRDPPLTLEQLRSQRQQMIRVIERIVSRLGPGLTQESVREIQDELLKATAAISLVMIRLTRQAFQQQQVQDDLLTAIRRGDPEGAIFALDPALRAFEDTFATSDLVTEAIDIAAEGGTIMSQSDLALLLGLTVGIGSLGSEIAQMIETYQRQVAQDVANTSRAAAISQVDRAFKQGVAPDTPPLRLVFTEKQVLAHLMNASGLTPRQALATDRYLDRLLKDGVPRAKALSLANEYAKRQLQWRAVSLSRTAILAGTNSGQQIVYAAAEASGLLDRRFHRKVWLTADDERVCPICGPLHEQTTDILGPFEALIPIQGGFSGARILPHPPAHPQCRCVIIVESVALADQLTA